MNSEKIRRAIFLLMFLCGAMCVFAATCDAQTAKKKSYSKHRKKPIRPSSFVMIPHQTEEVKNVSKVQKLPTVSVGLWGATGINLSVGKSSTQIQFDCADAQITEPLQIDSQGDFTADGFFRRANHGPVKDDATPKSVAARFSGKVAGNLMNLKITLIESGELIGEYVLDKDSTSKIRRCY